MGIISVLLYSQGMLGDKFYVPLWVVISCYVAIAAGTMSGGWRIVKTMGSKITRLTPPQGFCAEAGAAIMLYAATAFGIPVSSTHTITGAIVGVGASRRLSAVRWNVASNIVVAWVVTLPAAAIISAATWWITNWIVTRLTPERSLRGRGAILPARAFAPDQSGSQHMSIFTSIKDAIFGHPAAAQTCTRRTDRRTRRQPRLRRRPPRRPSPRSSIPDAALEKIYASKGNPDLNYKESIVDLMKLIGMDSSLDNRKQLADRTRLRRREGRFGRNEHLAAQARDGAHPHRQVTFRPRRAHPPPRPAARRAGRADRSSC